MKKFLPLIILAVVGFALYGSVKGFYNTTITLEENIAEKWSNVESAYQRRADLIPNLMKVAERYAKHEQETFVKVIEARSKATSIQIDPSNITPQQLEQFKQAQSGLTSAISRLLAVFERYPELKANENYKEMMNELERTENRIKIERDRFNAEMTPYNNHIRQFPGNILASVFNFEKKDRFNADEGADKAPDVNDHIKE
jgi:LemA protein